MSWQELVLELGMTFDWVWLVCESNDSRVSFMEDDESIMLYCKLSISEIFDLVFLDIVVIGQRRKQMSNVVTTK